MLYVYKIGATLVTPIILTICFISFHFVLIATTKTVVTVFAHASRFNRKQESWPRPPSLGSQLWAVPGQGGGLLGTFFA